MGFTPKIRLLVTRNNYVVPYVISIEKTLDTHMKIEETYCTYYIIGQIEDH